MPSAGFCCFRIFLSSRLSLIAIESEHFFYGLPAPLRSSSFHQINKNHNCSARRRECDEERGQNRARRSTFVLFSRKTKHSIAYKLNVRHENNRISKMSFASLNSAVEDKHASECGRMQVLLARVAIERKAAECALRQSKEWNKKNVVNKHRHDEHIHRLSASPFQPPRLEQQTPKMYKYLFWKHISCA